MLIFYFLLSLLVSLEGFFVVVRVSDKLTFQSSTYDCISGQVNLEMIYFQDVKNHHLLLSIFEIDMVNDGNIMYII